MIFKTLILILAGSITYNCAAEDKVITPNTVDTFFIGQNYADVFNEKSRKKLANEGIYFTFNNSQITSITVISDLYKTYDGKKIGDKINQSNNNEHSETELLYLDSNGISYILDNEVIKAFIVK
ncbi:hypothetical protein [uncultured Treponema sp.]|mgnify:FL=1|uniref:hypothetical protein n=1 Tax=uncultured Treponema sp. TaxID=162155 RepID=UPI0025D070CD|nr:hypothetical protein [uncultured Treponema sp.]